MRGVFVLPMAGLSSRFAAAGYLHPKYELLLRGNTIFSLVIRSIRNAFSEFKLVVAVRSVSEQAQFVESELAALGVRGYELAETGFTDGQATTVSRALQLRGVENNAEVLIFNIDTFRLRGSILQMIEARAGADGILEVFRASGEGWSFVRDDGTDTHHVAETTEKKRISDLCCTGLYYFRSAADFASAYVVTPATSGNLKNPERYVAPIYNVLINRGEMVSYYELRPEDIVCCGTPEEYEALRSRPELIQPLLEG